MKQLRLITRPLIILRPFKGRVHYKKHMKALKVKTDIRTEENG